MELMSYSLGVAANLAAADSVAAVDYVDAAAEPVTGATVIAAEPVAAATVIAA